MTSTRRILVDYIFKRYFDLGMGFSIELPKETLHSPMLMRQRILDNTSITDTLSKRLRLVGRIYEFTRNIPLYALDIVDSTQIHFQFIVNDLGYTCVGSRYDLVPTSLQFQSAMFVEIAEALPSEYRRCYETAVPLWMARTQNPYKALAFEAIRRGKNNLPS